jgi:hypothetical protein
MTADKEEVFKRRIILRNYDLGSWTVGGKIWFYAMPIGHAKIQGTDLRFTTAARHPGDKAPQNAAACFA